MGQSAPTPPDPYATAAAQTQTNEATARYQAEMNNVNQVNPYGSLTYTQTGTGPDGAPIYTATSQLNAPEQALFNNMVGTQTTLSGDANKLAQNLGNALTSAPNLGNDALVSKMMDWQNKYMQPVFDQQQSNLNAQLANQGITQGSAAYDNAQNLFSRNVNNAYENAMASDEGQAYNQALQSYMAPIQTLSTLLGISQPGSVNQGLVQPSQQQIQPANLEGLVEQNYQQQLNNYQNQQSGLFGIGSSVLGGLARIAPLALG
jgi:hypothetical protein